MRLFFGSTAILAGARRRVAWALLPVGLLWLGVLWAAVGGRAPGTAVVAPPAASVLQTVVASGDVSPVDGNFDRFDVEGRVVAASANRRGEVLFFATLLRSKAAEGWFLSSPGRIVKLAVVGDPVPGGERIAGFGEYPAAAINDSGAVAFSAQLTGGKSTSGVFLAQQGKLTAVAVSGADTPDTPAGTLAQFEPPVLGNSGDVAFLASVRRGRETGEAIYLWRRRQLSKLVASGDRVPGGGQFAGFGNPALNNKGEVAFGALVEQGPILGGVFLSSGKEIHTVLTAGGASPTGGIFARFSERLELNDAGTIALSAVLRQAGPEAAVFRIENDIPQAIAAIGGAAPGGGTFVALASWPVMSDSGAVAFIASLDGGPNGLALYLAGADGTKRIAAVGDALPGGGRIAAFPLNPNLAIAGDDGVTFAAIAERDGVRRDAIFYFGSPREKR
jgi:hypothetical protein